MSDAQIFQAFAVLYVAIGAGIFLNAGFYKKMFDDFVEGGASYYLGSIMALVVGYLIVAFHNTWTRDFSVIITILGWAALIKGVTLFVCPKAMIGLTKAILGDVKGVRIMGVVALILGLAFAFLGFCPVSPICQ